ncbi:unnamed protein product, partial [Mesorhabditis belari]|uniref:C-type lectin domain-containing protein n=1 Tax=Mesorhabditis belari TaxID=2138241 RepID=A0AAF3ENV7_9BILA
MVLRIIFIASLLRTLIAQCPEQFDYVESLGICLGSEQTGKSYTENEAVCGKNGGKLVLLNDAFKNTLLAAYVKQSLTTNRAMIGLHRNLSSSDPSWKWSDGSSPVYLHWAFNNPGSTDECTFLDGNDMYWYSGSCQTTMPYFCETGPPACNRCSLSDPKLTLDTNSDGARNFTQILPGFEANGCGFLLLNCTSQAIEYQATISIQYDSAGTEDGTPTALATLVCREDGLSWTYAAQGVVRSIDTVGCFPVDCDMVPC